MVFTESLIGIFDSIVEIKKNSKLPGVFKRGYTNYYIKKAIKEYDKSLEKVELNYDIIHDFVRFYLNSIDNVNKYFQYNLLKKGFTEATVGKDFARFVINERNIKYDIRFRSDSEIEVNKFEKERSNDTGTESFNIIFINHGHLDDKEFESVVKKEMIQYISYYLRTSVFTD